MIQCQIYISQSLGLYTLSRIHHKNGTITSRQASGYLIIEIHMTRSIYQVKDVLLPVPGLINDAHSLGLNGYSPLTLQIHIIKHLGLHLSACKKSRHLNDPVRQGRLTMVYMSYYAKIPNLTLIYTCHIYLLRMIFSLRYSTIVPLNHKEKSHPDDGSGCDYDFFN